MEGSVPLIDGWFATRSPAFTFLSSVVAGFLGIFASFSGTFLALFLGILGLLFG